MLICPRGFVGSVLAGALLSTNSCARDYPSSWFREKWVVHGISCTIGVSGFTPPAAKGGGIGASDHEHGLRRQQAASLARIRQWGYPHLEGVQAALPGLRSRGSEPTASLSTSEI